MDLSIVIVTYNTKDITKKCLETIKSSMEHDPSIKYEVILFDNNSHDGSKAIFENYPGINYIYNQENIGFGRGNNAAVKLSHGKVLLLLNSDIEVLEDAIPKMYKYYANNWTGHEFMGAKLYNLDMTIQPSAAPFYTLPIIFGALFLRGDYWGLTRYSPSRIEKVDWVSGACIMTKREFFNSLQGFDETIFMYMEEVDLLYRAAEVNLNTTFFPDSEFIHYGAISSGGRSAPIINVYKGFGYFYKKHCSPSALSILKFMLKLKAVISLAIGRIINNNYLITTYGEAYEIAKNL